MLRSKVHIQQGHQYRGPTSSVLQTVGIDIIGGPLVKIARGQRLAAKHQTGFHRNPLDQLRGQRPTFQSMQQALSGGERLNRSGGPQIRIVSGGRVSPGRLLLRKSISLQPNLQPNRQHNRQSRLRRLPNRLCVKVLQLHHTQAMPPIRILTWFLHYNRYQLQTIIHRHSSHVLLLVDSLA